MPSQIVPSGPAAPIRRKAGITVTFINQSATDVYIDDEPMRLNQTAAGAVPTGGTKVIANGGQLQISGYKGIMWCRAAANTTLEVQP